MKTKQQKRIEAQERQEQRDKRTVLDQLHVLDRKLGKHVGAKKERARLLSTNPELRSRYLSEK